MVRKQFIVTGVDSVVTFAGAFLQTFEVDDLNLFTLVPDHTGGMKRVGDRRNRGSPNAQHFREKILRKRQRVAAGKVAGPQHPAAKPRGWIVSDVACRGLLCLGVDSLLMTHHE